MAHATVTDVEGKLTSIATRLLKRADRNTVPSGILTTHLSRARGVQRLDGTPDAMICTQEEWQDAYHELANAAWRAEPAEDTLAMLRRAAPYHEKGQVPVFVAAYDYHKVRLRFRALLQRHQDSTEPFVDPPDSEIIEPRRAFFASAILPREYEVYAPLPHVHRGLGVTFVFPPEGWFANAAGRPESFQADFGDGRGFRTVRPGEPVDVRYATEGRKTFTLRCALPAGELISNSSFDVRLATAPQPDEEWYSIVAHEGYKSWGPAKGKAWVYYGSDNGVKHEGIKDAIIIAEGFPGGYTLDYLWDRLNQCGLATTLLSKGHALVILGFGDGTLPIQCNAFVAIACIEKVLHDRIDYTKISVGGASMGGLVTKYALLTMQSRGKSEWVARYLSVDTPHKGANAPIAVQTFTQFMKSQSATAAEAALLLATPASQQLLVAYVRRFAGNTPDNDWPGAIGPSHLRNEFMHELQNLGALRGMATGGVACGNGDGVGNGDPPGALAVFYACTKCNQWQLYISPDVLGGVVAAFQDDDVKRDKAYLISSGTDMPFDAAPGGVFTPDIFRTLYEGMSAVPPAQRGLYFANACFVPTVSALAVQSDDLFIKIRPGTTPSELGHIAAARGGVNLRHIALSQDLVDYLVRFVEDN